MIFFCQPAASPFYGVRVFFFHAFSLLSLLVGTFFSMTASPYKLRSRSWLCSVDLGVIRHYILLPAPPALFDASHLHAPKSLLFFAEKTCCDVAFRQREFSLFHRLLPIFFGCVDRPIWGKIECPFPLHPFLQLPTGHARKICDGAPSSLNASEAQVVDQFFLLFGVFPLRES